MAEGRWVLRWAMDFVRRMRKVVVVVSHGPMLYVLSVWIEADVLEVMDSNASRES